MAQEDSGLGWSAIEGSIARSTASLGTVNGRNYYKKSETPAVVIFCRNGEYWQPHLASTEADAVTLRADSGGPWGYEYTYTIDDVLWYFNSGNHGFNSSIVIDTTFPILDQEFTMSTQENAELFLQAANVQFPGPGPEPGGGFEIKIQNNASENIRVDKTLEDLLTLTGNLRHESSILDPYFLIACNPADLAGANYLTVEAWHRSYFINEIKIIRTGLVEITAHCDVLSSDKAGLRINKGIIRRAESSSFYNLYLNDGSLVAYQDPYILTEPFPAGFDGACFILAVAGG